MKPPAESILERPINQEAIVVHPDDLSAKLESMGDKALYQRFTISADAPRETSGSPDTLDTSTTPEAGERPPIDVTAEQYTEFTFNTPDSPNIQKWLADNNIQPGEAVNVRLMLPSGVVEQRVSTNPNTFFIPVDKLVEIETDESDHAQIFPGKAIEATVDQPISSEVLKEGEKYVYIPRKKRNPDGSETTRIEKWKLTTRFSEETGKQIAESLVPEKIGDVVDIVEKGIGESTLTPDAQEAYKQQFEEAERAKGHEVLEVVDVHDPAEANSTSVSMPTNEDQKAPETDPYDALPQDVKDEVDQYRAAQQAKRDSEREGRYADAADDGRWIYSVGKRISPAAQAFVGFRL